MHILFLSHYFPPEFNAPANRTFEHSVAWVKMPGVKVTVVTNNPNHPKGKLFPGFKNRWLSRKDIQNVKVHRVKTFLTPNAGFFYRALNYLFFVPMSILGSFGVKKPDVIIATSPQFFCALAGFIISRLKRKPFVFELRDIWPESIVAVGAMPTGFAVRLLEKIELYLYRHSAIVVALTDAFKDNLVSRGIEPDKIKVIPNGVDLELFQPRPKPVRLAQELGVREKKVIAYIGTLGMAHALENIVEVAWRLRKREDLFFLLVGDGALREHLQNKITELGLSNIRLLASVQRNEVVDYYALCDIVLVTLRNQPLFDTVLPSKMLEVMAMARPIIASVGRYSGQILNESGGGVWVPPEDVEALEKVIKYMIKDQNLLQAMGNNGRKYIEARYNRINIAKNYLEKLEKINKHLKTVYYS